jgi:Domain of unknown function (DUF5666)
MTEERTLVTDIPAPPYDDGDDEPEFRPRPRRRAHALTFVLAGALLVAAGFYGGVLVQKHEAGASTSTSGSGRASRFAAAGASGASGASGATGATGAGGFAGGGFAGGFGGGRGGAGGSGVAGTVKLVDGPNVYVTDTDGNVVKVTTSGSSQITRTDPATTKDVAPGDVVTVRGTQNSDGSYSATSLVIIPASATSTTPSG